MTDEINVKQWLRENKKYIVTFASIIVFGLLLMLSFDLGALHSCNKSGGILMTDYRCIDTEQPNICMDKDGRIMEVDDNAWMINSSLLYAGETNATQ